MKRIFNDNRTGSFFHIVSQAFCIFAAAGILFFTGSESFAAGKETSAILTEEMYLDEADSSIVHLECTYDGSGINYDNEARIGADTPIEVLPGTYYGVVTAGDTGYLPYGVRLVLTDGTSSITELTAAVWNEENGQDDLVWSDMNMINGKWRLFFSLADSDDPQLYHIHLYGADDSGRTEHLLDGLTLTVRQHLPGSGANGTDKASITSFFDVLQSLSGSICSLWRAAGVVLFPLS